MTSGPDQMVRDFEVLITASEAYPAFERLFMGAEREILCGFRIFCPWTRLRSPEALKIGETWFDLIAHTLSRGIRFSITITDFDPVVRPDHHRDTWSSIRALIAAAEASGRPDLLTATASLHPARVGAAVRLPLWPKILGEIGEKTNELNRLSARQRARFLAEAPHFRPWITERNGRLRPKRWPIPPLVPVTHHQKLAVFDQERLYIGGLDLNERRYDTPNHDRQGHETWHDVQIILHGESARAAHRHLQTFQDLSEGADVNPAHGLLRTLSRKRDFNLFSIAPVKALSEISDAHMREAESAEQLIYMETQFFRDVSLARHLAALGSAKPSLTMILVMPAAPEDIAYEDQPKEDARYGEYLQARCVDILTKGFGKDRLLIASPALPRTDRTPDRSTLYSAPLVYLHSKVSIFDRRSAIVSSANLNGRSLKWDTEAGVMLTEPDRVRHLQRRCFEHWLDGDAVAPDFLDLSKACMTWSRRAHENARLEPEVRKGFLLPYSAGPARRFGRNLPGIPEEMV